MWAVLGSLLQIERKESHRNDAGFSILELIVVMAIASIVMSILGLRINQSVENAKFRSAISDVQENLFDARMQALRERRSVELMNSDANSIEHYGWDRSPYQNKVLPFVIPHDVQIEGYVIINMWGACHPATMKIQSSAGLQRTLEISPRCVITVI